MSRSRRSCLALSLKPSTAPFRELTKALEARLVAVRVQMYGKDLEVISFGYANAEYGGQAEQAFLESFQAFIIVVERPNNSSTIRNPKG